MLSLAPDAAGASCRWEVGTDDSVVLLTGGGVQSLSSLAIQMQKEVFIEVRLRALQASLTDLLLRPNDLRQEGTDSEQ